MNLEEALNYLERRFEEGSKKTILSDLWPLIQESNSKIVNYGNSTTIFLTKEQILNSQALIKNYLIVHNQLGLFKIYFFVFIESNQSIKNGGKENKKKADSSQFLSIGFNFNYSIPNAKELTKLNIEKALELTITGPVTVDLIFEKEEKEIECFHLVKRVADNLYYTGFPCSFQLRSRYIYFSLDLETGRFRVLLCTNYMYCAVDVVERLKKWVLYFLDDCKTNVKSVELKI